MLQLSRLLHRVSADDFDSNQLPRLLHPAFPHLSERALTKSFEPRQIDLWDGLRRLQSLVFSLGFNQLQLRLFVSLLTLAHLLSTEGIPIHRVSDNAENQNASNYYANDLGGR